MTDEYKLEYLEMKTNYLTLKNELELNEMHGQGIVGDLRRGIKKLVSGPIPVAFEYYSKIFKGKISKSTKKGLDKIHADLKAKYFEAVPRMEAFEKEVNTIMSSMNLQTCVTGKAKGKYEKSDYIIYYLYPYERMAYKAINIYLANGGSLDDVRKFTGHVIDAFRVLTSQTDDGKNILRWDVYSTKAGVPLDFRRPDHYVRQALENVGVPLYEEVTIEMQRAQSNQSQERIMNVDDGETSGPVDSSLPAGVNAKKKKSRFGIKFRSPVKIRRNKSGGSVDDFWDSSDFSLDGGDLDSSFNLESGDFNLDSSDETY